MYEATRCRVFARKDEGSAYEAQGYVCYALDCKDNVRDKLACQLAVLASYNRAVL